MRPSKNFDHRCAALSCASMLSWSLVGCAGSLGGAAARRYERPILPELPLRSIDVAVTVAGPPVTSAPRFSVPSFEPPKPTSKIRPPVEEPATRAALVARLRRRLVDVGFDVRMVHAGAGLSVQPSPPIDTSTVTVASGRASSEPGDDPRDGPSDTTGSAVESPLAPDTTVRDLLDESAADAVLVVRVVPVDAFYVFLQDEENRLLDVGGGTTPASLGRDRPDVRAGRLLVGQAFLFDRKTGARLWTRHLPDLPEDGRIFPDDPFLEYGYVADASAGDPSNAVRAERSAEAFVRKMFADFPPPHQGTAGARRALEALDLADESKRQAFLDENHFAFELGGNWTLQTANLEGRAVADAIPDLETSFVAPNGGFRFEPRLGYVVAGGFTISAGGQVGVVPVDAQRSYLIDDDDRDPDGFDAGGTVELTGGSMLGLDLRLGALMPLSPEFFFWPTIGGFYERWNFDVTPDTIIPSGAVNRFGALINADAVWRFDDVFYGRVGAGFRAGVANQGGAIFGLELGLGLGLFL